MDNNKPQLIDLWRTSFDDSEEFIKLFFDRVYKKENALFIEKDGKIVSALQMLPYVMTYYGDGDIRKLYIWSLYPSFRTWSGVYAPTDTEGIRSDGKPESSLDSHYPGRSVAVRLLSRFRIYGGFRLFGRDIYPAY